MANRTRGRKAHRGNRRTEGRRLLQELLKTETQAAVASAIHARQQYVSSWARGLARPEPPFRDALERVYGLAATSWYSTDELAISQGVSEEQAKAS